MIYSVILNKLSHFFSSHQKNRKVETTYHRLRVNLFKKLLDNF